LEQAISDRQAVDGAGLDQAIGLARLGALVDQQPAFDVKALLVLGEVVPNADRTIGIVLPQHFDRAAFAPRLDQARGESARHDHFAIRIDVAEDRAIAFDRAILAGGLHLDRDPADL